MTSLFFVRHAQPDYRKGTDSTYELSEEGMTDRLAAKKALEGIRLDAALSSPYRRSIMTIEPIVSERGLVIAEDIRLCERIKGEGQCNTQEMFLKRWNDFDFCEKGGESLGHTQKRNVEAVSDILRSYKDKNVLIGTHGTAFSTIINYYLPDFGYDDFMRVIDFMPWVVRMDFDGDSFLGMEELAYVYKEFHGVK